MTLFPLPPQASCRIHPKPNRLDTEQKQRMYDDMLDHFSAPGLVLDSSMPVEGHHHSPAPVSKVPLNEEEKKFLVSRRSLIRQIPAHLCSLG
jgi:hypothetical protein